MTTSKPGASAKSLKTWLGVSMALNVFLLGAGIGGGYIAAKHFKLFPDKSERTPALDHITEGLSPANKDKVRDIITKAALDGEADMSAGREHRHAAVKLVLAATPDPKAISDEIRQARKAESVAKDKIEAAVVALLMDLPPEERAVVAERLVKTPFRARAKALYDVKKAEEAAEAKVVETGASASRK